MLETNLETKHLQDRTLRKITNIDLVIPDGFN